MKEGEREQKLPLQKKPSERQQLQSSEVHGDIFYSAKETLLQALIFSLQHQIHLVEAHKRGSCELYGQARGSASKLEEPTDNELRLQQPRHLPFQIQQQKGAVL